MDQDTYDQVTLNQEITGDLTPWLQPEMKFMVEWLGGKPIAINLPSTIELEVVETAPIMKTATKTASTKPATLSNGVTINVPEFVNQGEKVRVNPNTGEYLERVK